MEIRVTRVRKIFSDGRHNAFTGIAALGDKVFVTFRSAETHSTFDGVVKVIASADMESWDVVAAAAIEGLDLRDPKLATLGDTLLAYCGGRNKDGVRASLVTSSTDGVNFTEPKPVTGVPDGHWLWAVKPFGDAIFGTAYRTRRAAESDYAVALYRSSDGVDWEQLMPFPIPGSEVSIDFDPDGVLYALAREDGYGSVPAVCVAEPPYTQFRSVTRPAIRLQGPMIKRMPGGCLLAGRRWDLPGRRNLRTDLFWLPDGGDVELIRSLPSGGDTSYAGWLDLAEGAGVISYYSSHEHKMDEPHANNAVFDKDTAHAEHSTPADIFLADVSYA